MYIYDVRSVRAYVAAAAARCCVTTCGSPLGCKCSCQYCMPYHAMKIHESMWDVGNPQHLHLARRRFPSKSSDLKSSNPHVVEDPFRTAKRAPPCAWRKRNRPWPGTFRVLKSLWGSKRTSTDDSKSRNAKIYAKILPALSLDACL